MRHSTAPAHSHCTKYIPVPMACHSLRFLARHDARRHRVLLQQRQQQRTQDEEDGRHRRSAHPFVGLGAEMDQQDHPAGDGNPALRLEQLRCEITRHRRVAQLGEEHGHDQKADRRQAAPPEGGQNQRNTVLQVLHARRDQT
ncbi:hypothetical protein ABIC42_001812 [Variovorax sp. 1133]